MGRPLVPHLWRRQGSSGTIRRVMTSNTRTLIGSGSRTEDLAAYSRAVVDGDWVLVSGTIGLDPVTGVLPESARAQAQNAFATIEAALARAHATLEDVIRTRVYVTSR